MNLEKLQFFFVIIDKICDLLRIKIIKAHNIEHLSFCCKNLLKIEKN